MDLATIVGYLAAAASTSSFAPQAWKIIRTRETKDISTGMYVLTVLGFSLWTTYGILLTQWPLILTNGICLALSAFILTLKILPDSQKRAVADAVEPGAKRP
jgi:MtN3 and saliva related transmembrane protein